jgi:hypothetical protein
MIDDYRDLPGLNFSLIKKIEKHPSGIKKEFNEESKALALGSLFDFLITEDISRLKDEFLILEKEIEEPSDIVKTILKELYEKNRVLNLEGINEKQISDTCRQFNYGAANWSDETLYKKIIKYNDFYKIYFDNKIKIKYEDYEKSLQLKESYEKHSKDPENFKCVFQKVLNQEVDGILYKGKLDKILIDKKNKLIFPKDLKTTQDYLPDTNSSVVFKMLRFRYDIQGSLYSKLLEKEYPDYKIMPFEFIFFSYLTPDLPPVSVFLDKEQIEKSRKGFNYQNKRYKGWEELTNDYLFYNEINDFNISRECLENNFEFNFNI